MNKVHFYENTWFVGLLTIITFAIYFGGIYYFHSNGATIEQCAGWPVPFLFIGSIALPPIQFMAEKIFKK